MTLLVEAVIILHVANVRVASDRGRVIVFAPECITLGAGVNTVRDIVRSLTGGGFPNVTLDMAGTNYVDSAGIAELVLGFTTANNRGGSLQLNRLTGKTRGLLEMTKLYDVFRHSHQNVDALPAIEVSSSDISPLRAAESVPLLLSLRENHISVELGQTSAAKSLPPMTS